MATTFIDLTNQGGSLDAISGWGHCNFHLSLIDGHSSVGSSCSDLGSSEFAARTCHFTTCGHSPLHTADAHLERGRDSLVALQV